MCLIIYLVLTHLSAFPGALRTSGQFDYELVREHVLTIEAWDAGDPPLSDTCVVTVHVTDTNDNKPTFSQATYSASVREDAKTDDTVIRVRDGVLIL